MLASALLCLSTLSLASLSSAHISANPPSAAANSFSVIAFRVPHGCDKEPTNSITVKLPDGISSVKPQFIPGWTIEIKNRPLNPPITSHGKTVNETVDTITWSSQTPLPNDYFMDFGVSLRLPNQPAGTKLYFPTSQKCPVNSTNWDQVPKNDEEKGALPYPAPALTLLEAGSTAAGASTSPPAGSKPSSAGSVNAGIMSVFGAGAVAAMLL
ncbi:hypothetical protein BKA69DRAFT_1066580 [Paraphysoderma sedebokerense]|nr:hypothetical protein BKA69DRAFT_1066580 [Paraphysoderma sedebokerense]